jgi:hypothetical protein
MIHVIGKKPLAIENVGNHAPSYKPIVDVMVYEIMFGWIGQDKNVHVIRQSRTGMNSFSLELADGREFHFRGWETNNGMIDVKYTAQGNPFRKLKDGKDATWWIRRLKK